ncbi:MAG TPA: MmgE/PrpD family protein [Burkholderiales bacterium]|nr:MmgE/PrpD family protein [Burkholderiales bacterium]
MTSGSRSVTPELIRYLAQARTAPIPAEVRAKAKHHVLDTLAAMVSGTTIKPGAFALRYVEQLGGKPEAQVVGSGLLTSAVNAALANGMLAHADETDDSNGSAGIHPGCAVVPAALAMAEREDASGEEFLRAVILGYDVGCRTTKALGRDALRKRNHLPFSIGGTLGASAAAGCLARLDEAQFRHLLSCGAQQASGVMTYARDTEHIEKAFIFGGMPARNGVTAATLVQSGYTGVHDVFDGDGNFLAAYAESPMPQELVAELGVRYEVMLTNIKKYCVGFPIQSALEALTALMAEHGLDADEVERVTARLPESGAHTVNDREMPDVNLQYIFTVTLLDGRCTFEAAHSFERMKDPAVVALKRRITLIGDPELTRARPEGQALVEVATRDGRRLEKRATTFKGRAENPLTAEEVEEKARELIEPVLGKARCRQLLEAVAGIERVPSVRALRPLLKA